MAELGSRGRATDKTADVNIREILREPGIATVKQAVEATEKLRKELENKGLKGFKKGGKVKKTGPYKLHKGEKVIPAKKVTEARRNRMRRAMIGDK